MIGFIFKYHATPAGDLRDGHQFPDPNFWLKKVKAIWAICGPYKRRKLSNENGGTVFFVPYAYARRKLRLPPVCTGVLIVDRIIPDQKTLVRSRELSKTYKRLYKKDLKKHLDRDAREAPRTKKIRDKHIIIGGPKSLWLGKRCVNLVPILRCLKIRGVVDGLEHNRVVRSLNDNETEKLYDAVIREWRRTKPIQTPDPKHVRLRACRLCY